ncbi:MAG: hypothetical protein ACXABL_15130 [Candidatus Thorarchaeota archaeon]|jgi:hypothetical protein
MNSEVESFDTLEPPNEEEATAQAEAERQQGAIILAVVVISALVFFSLNLGNPAMQPPSLRGGLYVYGVLNDSEGQPLIDVDVEVWGSSNPTRILMDTTYDGSFSCFIPENQDIGSYIIIEIPNYNFTSSYPLPETGDFLDVGIIVL